MKLKPKHFEIAKTISYFVDRNYYPNFVEPTKEQIDIFTQIESMGSSHLSPNDMELVEPMLNGKERYDLQIKMIHEEIAEWIKQRWGWYYPIASIIQNVFPERHKCKIYVKMLIKLMRKMKEKTGIIVMMEYSGFSDEYKYELSKDYFKS